MDRYLLGFERIDGDPQLRALDVEDMNLWVEAGGLHCHVMFTGSEAGQIDGDAKIAHIQAFPRALGRSQAQLHGFVAQILDEGHIFTQAKHIDREALAEIVGCKRVLLVHGEKPDDQRQKQRQEKIAEVRQLQQFAQPLPPVGWRAT